MARETRPPGGSHNRPDERHNWEHGYYTRSGRRGAPPLTPERRTRRTRRTLWPLLVLGMLALAVIAAGAGGVMVVQGVMPVRAFGARSPLPDTLPTVPPAMATPTPRVAVNPNPILNMRNGCVGGQPPAASRVVFTGQGSDNHPPPNEIALTFDDGPTPDYSPQIIDYLAKTHTPATFFVEGQYAQLYPELVRREWLSGFAIGMHSWDHPFMTRLSERAARDQFVSTRRAIHAAIGNDACVWFWRPPYMDLNKHVFNQARELGLTTIDWNDDTRDFSRPGAERIAATALAEATPGGIILMHDGPAAREQTLAALPLIIEGLKARGLKPVTIPELMAHGRYPGVNSIDGVFSAGWKIGAPPAIYKNWKPGKANSTASQSGFTPSLEEVPLVSQVYAPRDAVLRQRGV